MRRALVAFFLFTILSGCSLNHEGSTADVSSTSASQDGQSTVLDCRGGLCRADCEPFGNQGAQRCGQFCRDDGRKVGGPCLTGPGGNCPAPCPWQR
jgi:hypothetical protein